MNVLSLFDGISCGYLALQKSEIPIENYYAYEINKYALRVSKTRFSRIQHFGDVRDADFSFHKNIDLLIGGSPCTDLSCAKQNRQGLKGTQSSLFWEFVRALKEVNPKYFLLENVASMSKTDRAAITEALGVDPILINSALVSAQNRRRLYWTNISNIMQPKDKGIKLADILENGNAFTKKSYCVTANIGAAYFKNTLEKHTRTMIAVPAKGEKKSKCITATYAKTSLNDDLSKQSKTIVAIPAKGCAVRSWPRERKENRIYNHLEIRKDEKSNSLTSHTKDSMVCKPLKIGAFGKGGQANRIYSVYGKSVCIKSGGGGQGAKTGLYKIDLPDGDYYIRKLTPLECERLQTLPDGYTDVGISNTQRYKCLGNAWTVDVIAHIFSFLKERIF